ncbi:MAG: acylneuraminate cytidylyltransferase family protein [Candidatus Omnitrophota bacterium]
MYKNKKILALVPARGGSKGLPGKNIRMLSGKPLIAWSIEQALASRYIDRVVVSTESKEIAAAAKKYGAPVPFMRPDELATDKASSIGVILHALGYFSARGEEYDYLVLLEPTSPLRAAGDLDSAIKKLVDNSSRADSLVSVGEIRLESPFIAKTITGGYVAPLIKMKKRNVYRRQQLPKAYFPYGVIYASKVKTLEDKLTFYQKRTMPYFIERWQNYEIDDIYDFYCIEAVLKERLRGR